MTKLTSYSIHKVFDGGTGFLKVGYAGQVRPSIVEGGPIQSFNVGIDVDDVEWTIERAIMTTSLGR